MVEHGSFKGLAMNTKLVRAFWDGFRGSFKLSLDIALAVWSVIASFAHHTLSLRATPPEEGNSRGRESTSDPLGLGVHHAGSTLFDDLRQAHRLRQHLLGIEVCRADL